ncbi:hypothetical protein [Cellulomonas sp. SG140]|uniref:hypothetical protein n=1 Tax=Cellulomonas sp. SG140 TaxID=2976536 RepID=UPI0021E90149|nr:hypothetical protein [Cellulomonas sp. SG140]
MATLRTNRRGAIHAARMGWAFLASNLTGRHETYAGPTGILPEPWRTEYREALQRARDTHQDFYVVRSYATPIAWRVGTEDAVIPDVRYSSSTSRHQSAIRLAYGPADERRAHLAATA